MPVDPFAGDWELALTFKSTRHWDDLTEAEKESMRESVYDVCGEIGWPMAQAPVPSIRLFTARLWVFKFVVATGSGRP